MGSAASKQRSLKATGQVIQSVQKSRPQRAGGGAEPSSGTDAKAAAGGEHAALLKRLSHLDPNVAPNPTYKPSTTDNMSATLRARSEHEISDKELAQGTSKLKVPEQTISQIVAMLQRNEPHEDIIRAFQIDPSLIAKLDHLRIPRATGGVGVRR